MKSATLEEMALAHRYRRWLLYSLFTYANPVGLPDIAHRLTVWERWDDGDDLLQKRLTVYNALYHDHLPALGDDDLVTYYQQDDEVELGSAAARIEALLGRRLESEVDALLAAKGEATNAYGVTE